MPGKVHAEDGQPVIFHVRTPRDQTSLAVKPLAYFPTVGSMEVTLESSNVVPSAKWMEPHGTRAKPGAGA